MNTCTFHVHKKAEENSSLPTDRKHNGNAMQKMTKNEARILIASSIIGCLVSIVSWLFLKSDDSSGYILIVFISLMIIFIIWTSIYYVKTK